MKKTMFNEFEPIKRLRGMRYVCRREGPGWCAVRDAEGVLVAWGARESDAWIGAFQNSLWKESRTVSTKLLRMLRQAADLINEATGAIYTVLRQAENTADVSYSGVMAAQKAMSKLEEFNINVIRPEVHNQP